MKVDSSADFTAFYFTALFTLYFKVCLQRPTPSLLVGPSRKGHVFFVLSGR